jgi:hypothetical protein
MSSQLVIRRWFKVCVVKENTSPGEGRNVAIQRTGEVQCGATTPRGRGKDATRFH